MEILEIISWTFIFIGLFLVISGSLGVLRFPNVFARLHPAGVVDSLGAPLVLGGLMIQSGLDLVTLKLAILMLFILLTSPTACHALAKAAYWEKTDGKK